LASFLQGERLYDFLERQVGDQMRTALKEPLHNISDNILNRVISKSIQADLRKYKMGKSLNRTGTTALRDRTRSPASKRAAVEEYGEDVGYDNTNFGDLSGEVSSLLSQLSQASGNKMSLIKMQVIKCDENSNNFKRMRQSFNRGDLNEADRLMAMMEESNHQSLLDLQNEISDGVNMIQTISMLCDHLKREKKEAALSVTTRGRSPGGYAQSLRNRSASGGRYPKANGAAANAGGGPADYAKYDAQIADMRRNLQGLEEENEKLRNTMREMVDDYTRQLELRDETIRNLEKEGIQSIDGQRQEVVMLREKIGELNREIDMLQAGQAQTQHLKDEIEKLNRSLLEKDRYIDRQLQQQKNEWADIYGTQKQTNDMLQQEIGSLRTMNQELVIKLEMAEKRAPNFGGAPPLGGPSAAEFQDTAKRLKKREAECQALWDTLRDMKKAGTETFDAT
jgi:hypothetical protein